MGTHRMTPCPTFGAKHLRPLMTGVAAILLLLGGCSDPKPTPELPMDPGPEPMDPRPGTQQNPIIEVSPRGGLSPLQGTLTLVPSPGGAVWDFAVDLTDDGEPEHEGRLQEVRVELDFIFEEIGAHEVRVTFMRPDNRFTVERFVFVFDPATLDLPILAVNVVDVPKEDLGFEGITADRTGDAVYVASYDGGEIFRLDATDLRVVGRSDQVGSLIEGLAVSPSNRFLFAQRKPSRLAVLEIPSLEILRIVQSPGRFYVHALDDTRVVVDGGLLDTASGAMLGSFFSREQHFAVSPDGETAAGLVPGAGGRGQFLQVVDLQSLSVVDSFPMPDFISGGKTVAFHPSGERIYVVAVDHQRDEQLLVFDTRSGELLSNLVLGPDACFILCVANPVATSHDGRWVVFARESATYFIDTARDLPLHRITGFGLGSGVAASPTEDAFYFLNGLGVVTKVAAPQVR